MTDMRKGLGIEIRSGYDAPPATVGTEALFSDLDAPGAAIKRRYCVSYHRLAQVAREALDSSFSGAGDGLARINADLDVLVRFERFLQALERDNPLTDTMIAKQGVVDELETEGQLTERAAATLDSIFTEYREVLGDRY